MIVDDRTMVEGRVHFLQQILRGRCLDFISFVHSVSLREVCTGQRRSRQLTQRAKQSFTNTVEAVRILYREWTLSSRLVFFELLIF